MAVRGFESACVPDSPCPGAASARAHVRCVVWCPPDQGAPEALVRALEARSITPRLARSHWGALAHLIAAGADSASGRMLILVSASRLEHVDEVVSWMRTGRRGGKAWVFDPADSPPLRAYLAAPAKPTVVVGAMIERLPRGFRLDDAGAPVARAGGNGRGSGAGKPGLRLVGEASNGGDRPAGPTGAVHTNGHAAGGPAGPGGERPPLTENGSGNGGDGGGDDVLTPEELRMLLHGEPPDDPARRKR